MKYKKYKTEEERKKKKKLLAILLPCIFGVAAAVAIPTAIVLTKDNNPTPSPSPSPTPTPTPDPKPYTGPTFKFKGTVLLGFCDGVTQSIVLERFPNGSITIPECSEIADGAFDGKMPSKITNLILPSNTTKIGDSAFANNPNISIISFYEGKDISDWKVKTLGAKAFYNTGIETFTTPFDLVSVGKNCFDKCNKLKYLDLRISDSESGIKFDSQSFANLANEGTVMVRVKTTDYWKTTLSNAGLVDKDKTSEFSSKWKIIEYSCIDVDDQGICYGFKRDIPNHLKFLVKLESNPLTIPNNVIKISNQYGGFSNNQDIKELIIPSSVLTIEEGCFLQCNNINSIDISDFKTIPNWVGKGIFNGCNEKGIFHIVQDMKVSWRELLDEVSGLIIDKDHWKVGLDSIEKEYCVGIVANSASSVKLTWSDKIELDMNISYDGITWNKYNNDDSIYLSQGQTIYFQGNNPEGLCKNADSFIQFWCEEISEGNFGDISLKGSVMGLLTGGWDISKTIPCDYCFYRLFHNCKGLTSIDPNFLPATNLTKYCYLGMFSFCNNLTNSPKLPAKQLYEGCYSNMFEECRKLVTAPELNSTQLAPKCYYWMFMRCNELTTPVNLPATKLYNDCYNKMYFECKNIKTINPLPATQLEQSCYFLMFAGCKEITKVEIMAQTLANASLQQMFSKCSNLVDITIHFESWPDGCTRSWLASVADEGVVHGPLNLEFPSSRSSSTIPSTWTYDPY